ncbi:MAG: low molecular weight phosphotyrosine protein phosphatase [Firmicutes bacterium]|uniref:protein-tyrosine-phosphatase n=1 Tax=Candidatus Gallilactobacillus intestinavium TaxID=2840838 RepID=A0A9D9E450_9LACO|nr:low molecular weight phosphotyrosine protein phosphatase [Candidatus Gallilactobacillus intestinavium]
MKKIMFVCLGNICRSPMAQIMFQEIINQNKLNNKIMVDSAATSDYEIGNSIYQPAFQILKQNNYKNIEHKAKQINDQDFANFDYIVGMDKQNIINLKQMCPKKCLQKIHLIYDISATPTNEIKDPWYTNDFQTTFNQLKEILPLWLQKLINELS